MKVIILAGGLGTRISEYTKTMPKPMIRVKGKPIIFHIMKHYANYGYKDFIIAGGYKSYVIKNFFKQNSFGWNVRIINTGKKTMTGGRLKRLKKYLSNETFMFTYGDGISDVNINKLIKFHKINKKMITLTAVRPTARFGAIKLKKNKVIMFREKSKLDEGWINGGFFVAEPYFLNFIKNDSTFLEKEPLLKASKKNQLVAFKHEKFWQCIDTKRDLDIVEKLIK